MTADNRLPELPEAEHLRSRLTSEAIMYRHFGREKSGWVKIHTSDLNLLADLLRDAANALAARDAEDSKRLDWVLTNSAVVETDGDGNWWACLHWTAPEMYFPKAKDQRAALDAALQADAARAGEE